MMIEGRGRSALKAVQTSRAVVVAIASPVHIAVEHAVEFVPVAEHFDVVAVHKDEASAATFIFDVLPKFGRAIVAAVIEGGDEALSEKYFAVCHIVVRADRQNAVVGEPYVVGFVIERVAVLFAYRAVCGEAKMDDTSRVSVPLLYLFREPAKR